MRGEDPGYMVEKGRSGEIAYGHVRRDLSGGKVALAKVI